jgi:hypothetical protein
MEQVTLLSTDNFHWQRPILRFRPNDKHVRIALWRTGTLRISCLYSYRIIEIIRVLHTLFYERRRLFYYAVYGNRICKTKLYSWLHTAPLRCFVLPGGGKKWSCSAYRVHPPSASIIRFVCVAVTRLDAARSRLANASNPVWQMSALCWGMRRNWLQLVFRNCSTGHPTPLHILSSKFVLTWTESGRWIAWGIYRVIYTKSLRDFRTLRYRSRDGHAEGEHVNRGKTLQVSVLLYRCSICPPLVTRQMSIL